MNDIQLCGAIRSYIEGLRLDSVSPMTLCTDSSYKDYRNDLNEIARAYNSTLRVDSLLTGVYLANGYRYDEGKGKPCGEGHISNTKQCKKGGGLGKAAAIAAGVAAVSGAAYLATRKSSPGPDDNLENQPADRNKTRERLKKAAIAAGVVAATGVAASKGYERLTTTPEQRALKKSEKDLQKYEKTIEQQKKKIEKQSDKWNRKVSSPPKSTSKTGLLDRLKK